ncbi:MAG TPA: phosphoribosylformimino-5-aminoimidazole carboxamide ribotide isomerase, partial [Polyangiaceae bacterium]
PPKMTLFRPCIDLHHGLVKQIVGGSLDNSDEPTTNFVSDKDAAWFARRYRHDGLTGGHMIMLGPGNERAAEAALSAWQGGLQVGGGITADNGPMWIVRGADKVIVTSFLFTNKAVDLDKVKAMVDAVGQARLVIDLSCRRTHRGLFVATDRWQTITETPIDAETLGVLATYCSEYLVHAADVEGQCRGIDEELVRILGESSPIACTYAGGAKSLDDLARVEELSRGRVDLTFGSALDIFGGALVHYDDCVRWNEQRRKRNPE